MNAHQEPPEIAVRLAGPRDAALVARLLHAFNVEFETPTPTPAEFEARFEVLLWRDDVRVWLAETTTHPGGAALGFLLATHRPSPYHAGGIAQVEELYAVPTRRGTGVGTALMGALDAWVTRHEVGEVHINVDEVDQDARRFYERRGFSHLDPTALAAGEPAQMLCYVRDS
ncbi:GNAT family N-acetyltransferase [Nocardioides gilvus]|uniref:GNAT family N-acetyltransferase n=1 Tax=Nocardioides gilvus TaxID=1735589 RepID=UPI000D745598|nr:GNAT family N-acetyltransferase [Nocardioides gilvus]